MEITEDSLFEIVDCKNDKDTIGWLYTAKELLEEYYEDTISFKGDRDLADEIIHDLLNKNFERISSGELEKNSGFTLSQPGEVENKISAQKNRFYKQMMEIYPPIKPTPNIEFILLDKEKGKLQINAWNEEETSQLFCNVGLDEKFSKQSILGSGWTFNFHEFLFDKLAESSDILEMSPDTHYNVMCTIENDILWLAENDQDAFPYYYEGVKNYLDYCEKHSITKEFIEKETGLEPPEVQKIVDKSKKIFDESKYAKPKHDSVKGSESVGRGAVGRPVEKKI